MKATIVVEDYQIFRDQIAQSANSTENAMRSDRDIKRDVEDELRWDPDIDSTDIAVSVNNAVVTLTGFVRSYMQKYEAEKDAKRVAGVAGGPHQLVVRLPAAK